MAESKNGHNFVNISRNSLQSLTGYLNIDLSHMSNIRILAQVVLKIWCGQGFSIANGRVENGHKFAILGPTDKNSAFAYFFILMLHIKFKVPSSSGSLLSVPRRGVTDRRTGPNQYAPPQLLRSGRHKNIREIAHTRYHDCICYLIVFELGK